VILRIRGDYSFKLHELAGHCNRDEEDDIARPETYTLYLHGGKTETLHSRPLVDCKNERQKGRRQKRDEFI
jgi:hypothetical protein